MSDEALGFVSSSVGSRSNENSASIVSLDPLESAQHQAPYPMHATGDKQQSGGDLSFQGGDNAASAHA